MALKCKLTHDECQISTWYLFICNVEDRMSDTKNTHKQQTKTKQTKQNKKHTHVHFGLKCHYLR